MQKNTREQLIEKWSNVNNSKMFINACFDSLSFKRDKKIKEIVDAILDKLQHYNKKEFNLSILDLLLDDMNDYLLDELEDLHYINYTYQSSIVANINIVRHWIHWTKIK